LLDQSQYDMGQIDHVAYPNGRRTYHWRASKPITATNVSLEITLGRPLLFEFIIDPKEINRAQR
jgi:hypothetical protein